MIFYFNIMEKPKTTALPPPPVIWQKNKRPLG
jgi:hypothetical protein